MAEAAGHDDLERNDDLPPLPPPAPAVAGQLNNGQPQASPPPLPPLYLPKVVRRSAEADRDTPLHTACLTGNYDQALMLLLRGHDPSPTNIYQQTPLHHSTSRGHLDIMMLLLDGSALVNATDHDGLTPLHQAIIHGNRDACELLLCYRASIHGRPESSSEVMMMMDEGITTLRLDNTTATSTTATARSPLELASHVHVCHHVISNSVGRVWSLQHLCRIVIRRSMGVSRRRRLKELPLPPHLIVFLSTLPVTCSDDLHANWERRRSNKSESTRKRGEARRRGRGGGGRGIHHIRNPLT